MQKLSIKGVALAFGILWALGNLFAGIGSLFGWGVAYVNTMGSLYVGFMPTPAGIIIGTIWSFIDGFIAGAIFSWLYNKLSGAQ